MLRTGILLPRSTLYPALGIDLLNGIKSFLQQEGVLHEFSLLTENIGFGIDDQEIYSKAEKLLLQDDVSIVIAIADNRVTEMLGPLFAATNKLLLVVNFGANFSESWHPSPATIIHSPNFSLHTRLTGKMAAAGVDKKAAYAISYLDGGYKLCYSMLNSHQQQGGEPCYTFVSHFKPESFTLESLETFLEENKDIKKLLCLFSGDTAALFYKAIQPLQRQNQLLLFVSPMMLEESVKDFAGSPLQVKETKGYTPWTRGLENEHNQLFKNSYEKATTKKVNLFAMLGWETGQLLQQWMEQVNTGATSVPAIINSLGNKTFNSPRGWLKLDLNTNHTYGPAWLLSCSGNMELTIVEEKNEIEKEWMEFTSEPSPTGDSSSWKNTYLCV